MWTVVGIVLMCVIFVYHTLSASIKISYYEQKLDDAKIQDSVRGKGLVQLWRLIHE